jgi:hypothetical protein
MDVISSCSATYSAEGLRLSFLSVLAISFVFSCSVVTLSYFPSFLFNIILYCFVLYCVTWLHESNVLFYFIMPFCLRFCSVVFDAAINHHVFRLTFFFFCSPGLKMIELKYLYFVQLFKYMKKF